jgi:oligopeptide transport system substrate-binding protein
MSSQVPFAEVPEGTVTFLFTDIEGSTKLLKRLRDEYKRLLAEQREILRTASEKWGGREVDTQGDAFFVAFPRATDAVNAAVDIQRELVSHEWPAGVEVRVRMGLHTGEPWVEQEGYVGMDVHRAARIAHVGHGGQVLVSETTAPLLRDELPEDVSLLDLGRHRLKDMKSPEHIRQVVIEGFLSEFPPLKSLEALPPEFSLEPGPDRLPAFLKLEEDARPGPIFVGREKELARLNNFLDDTLFGKGGVVFVSGGPGRGKTALIQAFARNAMETHPELLVAGGECSAFTGAADPYLPFKHILSMLTGDLEARWSRGAISHAQALRLWECMPATIQTLMVDGPDLIDVFVPGKGLLERSKTAMEGRTSWLERLAKICESERPLPGEFEQKNLFEQYEAVLGALAPAHPLVILLDDLQWADSASINLLFHLGRLITSHRILILGAYRPEEVSMGRKGEPHPLEKGLAEFKRLFGDVQIDLSEIPDEEDRAFVEAFVDSEPNGLSESFHNALYKHTKGHPLFTIELLRNLQERGNLVKDDEDKWVEGHALDWTVLPARVEGVIEERISRLEGDLKETLTIASVEGEDFTAQVVGQVQELSERKILGNLSRELEKHHRLVKAQEETRVGDHIPSSYRFTHTLFQQFLYNDLSPGEQRLLHRDVAEVLERLYDGQADEIAVQLAYHYSEAGQSDQAIHYLLISGDQARASYAYEEAIDFYLRALALQKQQGLDNQAARSLMKLGLTYHTHLDFQNSHKAYMEGFELWIQPDEAPLESSTQPSVHPLKVSCYNPPTLDPGKSYDVTSTNVIGHIFSGLVELTPGLDLTPDVARSWELMDGGRKYLFRLRENVVWSDGRPVTASDFEYAWKRIIDPSSGSQNAPKLYDIVGAMDYHQGGSMNPADVGIRVIDAHTLEVQLEEPTGYFMHLLSDVALFPVPKHVVEIHGARWTEPENIVTNGPFILKEFIPGENLLLIRYSRYHGPFNGNIQEIDFHLVEEMSSMEQRYESNQIDVLRLWGLPPQEVDRSRHRRVEEYVLVPGPGIGYLGFNVSRPPFNDLRVRKAFAMSIDKETLNHVLLRGLVLPATGGFLPAGFPGHSEGIGIPYDPEQAQKLLAEAGYTQEQVFPPIYGLTFIDGAAHTNFLQSSWVEILGIETSWEILEFGAYFEKIAKEPVQVFGAAWIADYPDPDSFLRTNNLLRLTNWQNEVFENCIESARHASDQDERMRLYRQADRLLVEEAIIVPLSYFQDHILVKTWLRRFPVSPQRWLHGKEVILEPH